MSTQLENKARGAWLGQIIGDALGTTVEFMPAEEIARSYPDGLRELVGGGPFSLEPGQVTDDTEMALGLARAIVKRGCYEVDAAAAAYVDWCRSGPFDMGATTRQAFQVEGTTDGLAARCEAAASRSSQSNGSLMRCSPLGIYGWKLDPAELTALAEQDSRLSHPHPACVAACAILTHAIAHAIRTGDGPRGVFDAAVEYANETSACEAMRSVLLEAANAVPADFQTQMGWVRIALQNAFHRLLHAPDFEEGLVATVAAGGDTDTNGCIAGALLGAVHGEEGIPERWRAVALGCRTDRGEVYQTGDARELVVKLLEAGA